MKKLFSKVVFFILVIFFGYVVFKSFVLMKKAYFKVSTPFEISLKCKDFFSSKQEKIVFDYFNKFLREHSIVNFEPKIFYDEIISKVPVIKDVVFNIDNSKMAILLVTGILPKFVVNQDFVIAENYKVYPKEFFECFDFNLLRMLKISEKFCNREISPKLYDFLQTIPSEVWNHYTLFYEGPTLIRLNDVENKNEIVVDEKSIFENEKFENMSKIYSDIEARKNGKNSLNKKLVFDMRFERRILVKAENF